MMALLFFWTIGVLICGIIGGVCGANRGRGPSGFLLGALFGPLGILLALFLPEDPKAKASVAVKRARAEYKKPDPLDEFEARERAKVPLAVPKHLRGRRVEDDGA